MMPKWQVDIQRIQNQRFRIIVEAKNEASAREIAVDTADELPEWETTDVDYFTHECIEVPE